MLFSQVWMLRRATRSNLAKLQTFQLEKPRGSIGGLRCSFVFWISLYKDYYKLFNVNKRVIVEFVVLYFNNLKLPNSFCI